MRNHGIRISPSTIHTGLTKILHVAATFGLVVGSELHEKAAVPKDHVILTSFANAAVSEELHWLPATHSK